MELEKNKKYHLELRGEEVEYKGFDEDYIIKDGHGCRKGFHIFVNDQNRRFVLSEEEVQKKISQPR